MRIRSIEELEESLSIDLAWRKKEFTNLKFMIEKNNRNHEKELLLRSAIALFYSHWEGHIKHCSLAYLTYINHKGLSLEQLTDNFCQIYLGKKFNNCSIQNINNQKEIFHYFNNLSNEKFDVMPERTIDTESNLKYKVLQKILMQLGFVEDCYSLKSVFIDEKLIKLRNQISHGEKVNLDDLESVYDDIKQQLLEMIQLFNDTVLNYAQNQYYLKQAS